MTEQLQLHIKYMKEHSRFLTLLHDGLPKDYLFTDDDLSFVIFAEHFWDDDESPAGITRAFRKAHEQASMDPYELALDAGLYDKEEANNRS